MRTIQVINVKWYNATAWYAIYLAHTLKKLGHPTVIVISPDSYATPYAEKLGLDVYEMPLNSHKMSDILTCNKLINTLCQEFKPHIVNCHRGESFFLWALKKRKFGYALVRTRGDQRLPATDFFNRFLHNVCANAIIATNTKMEQYFVEKMHTPATKIYTILGGVDTKQFYPDMEKRKYAREQLHFTDKDIVIGIIGRFDPVKGFYQCLEAFSGIFENQQYIKTLTAKDTKKIHLVLMGRNCNFTLEDLKNVASSYNIPKEYVHFLHDPPDMNMQMNMLDLGIIASIASETIARVAFEMLACDVPIISSDVGVMPDIVPAQNIYAFNDLKKLTELFLQARDENFIQEGTKIFRQRFHADQKDTIYDQKDFNMYGWTLDNFAQKTVNVYEKCLTFQKK